MRARRRGRGPLGDLGPDARADGGTRTHASVREVRRSPELRPQEPHCILLGNGMCVRQVAISLPLVGRCQRLRTSENTPSTLFVNKEDQPFLWAGGGSAVRPGEGKPCPNRDQKCPRGSLDPMSHSPKAIPDRPVRDGKGNQRVPHEGEHYRRKPIDDAK